MTVTNGMENRAVETEMPVLTRKSQHFVKDNSLSLVLFVLFLICISAQSLAGLRLENEILTAHGKASIGYGNYLATGSFWEGLASNWQAAVLQLGSLIVFSSFLYQRGAPHSRDPDKSPDDQVRIRAAPFRWYYRYSMSLVFLLLFLLTLVLHVVFGTKGYNEQRSLTGEPPISIANYLISARFWSVTLQTWQAEYLVIALYVVLSVFLRQQGSPESKPVESSNQTTGEANK